MDRNLFFIFYDHIDLHMSSQRIRYIWTKDEASFLYATIRQNVEVLGSSKSNGKSQESKRAAWDEVVSVHNFKFGDRPIITVQPNDKWRCHKQEVKATTAKQRRSIMATGNSEEIIEANQDQQKTESLIGKKKLSQYNTRKIQINSRHAKLR